LAHHLFYRNTKINYFLDERDDRFNYWKQRRQVKEAEVFAAYLLIPEDRLDEKLKEECVQESLDNSRTRRGIPSLGKLYDEKA
jgi:Zn-dependent peptidase ImmA (M78 family)